MKRALDFICSLLGLVCLSPILLTFMFLVWRQDYNSPFYIAKRTGLHGRQFSMVKLRSMVVNADKSGVDSTSNSDMRITKIGHLIRKFKLDEITQLWNVLIGDMSLVGPRPNVKRETDLYTAEEIKLLSVKPGITDISSIVFSDEGEILNGKDDPDIAYHQLIRPGKGYLGLFYIEHRSFSLDLKLIALTIVSILSKERALKFLASALEQLGASADLLEVVKRKNKLRPMPPPGAKNIVMSRDEFTL